MKRVSQILLLLMVITSGYAQQPSIHSINAVIGDESFLRLFGSLPDETVGEQLRIQTHLSYVENKLRQQAAAHLNNEQQQNRIRVLDLLHDYWTRGVFPSNFDYPNQRRPCFIDRNGNICAVGYLIEQTTGREEAENINIRHQYDYLLDMHEESIAAWANEHGLTLEECAMIQPSYGYIPADETNEMPVKTSYGISSGVVGGINVAVAMAHLSNRGFGGTKTVSRIGLLSGSTQIILGLANLRKSELQYEINGPSTRYSYKAQNNLSYINIAAGTATLISSALNLHLNKKKNARSNVFNLYSYPGMNRELNMGLTFTKRI